MSILRPISTAFAAICYPDELMREDALLALRNFEPERHADQVLPIVVKSLSDPNWRVVSEANAVLRIMKRAAMPVVKDLVSMLDRSANKQQTAVTILDIDPNNAVAIQFFVAELDNSDKNKRCSAVGCLASLDVVSPQFRAKLSNLLADADPQVHDLAKEARKNS